MRIFILICFVTVACGDKFGYNYEPVGHLGTSGTIGNGHFDSGIGDLGYGSLASPTNNGFGNIAGADNNEVNYNVPSYSASTDVQKEFYTFSAPENAFDDDNLAQKIAGSIKKGLRVIFIKSPENNGLEKAALALAKQAAEQKTSIYVLNKQADIGDLVNKFNGISNNSNNKPEVHFVKYRTPEDAVNAQKTIEREYDSLGGASQSHNGGVAPLLNFASKDSGGTATSQTPGNAYLPSSIFRH